MLGATSPSALRHADLLRAELLAARGDTTGALHASTSSTSVTRHWYGSARLRAPRPTSIAAAWQLALGLADSADAEWLWYESSDFEGWPTGPPQEGELDAILSVYARLLRGELEAAAATWLSPAVT